ncbi:DUF1254 domain-containing protein [Photobacterium sp. WH24]|uniref:DUF1254 domain-containing protein n=1 Tax=Photobacterium sp. WH24 TaxID=2827237 RepID=UPI001C497137|nr:DUF1254 domain-containing protein [Photobacterium sp. WH24]MBV7261846.1 DUF1254 domain-containing protein [Photobacterium sp. WH24]
MILSRKCFSLIAALPIFTASLPAYAEFTKDLKEARAIAEEAYIYGYPVVEMYKTLYVQAVDKNDSNFKADFNQIGNTSDVYTPKDTSFITPNSDTPYSFVWMDLRAEPIVLTLPKVESERYYSVQLIDIYTQNFAYLGTRTTGNDGGVYMVTGPNWQGGKPSNVSKVIRSESEIVYALYRTQLIDDSDIDNVRKIQSKYKVEMLSDYLNEAQPKKEPRIAWPKLTSDMSTTPAFFSYLDFMLDFAPTVSSEKDIKERLSKIGIGTDEDFSLSELSQDQLSALQDGMNDGRKKFATFKKDYIDNHKVTSGDFFGTREQLKNQYLYRYSGAALGIFGNSADEAMYLGYFIDSENKPLDASKNNYQLRFEKGSLPPAKAFWSLTMYDGENKFLVENKLNRYLINSPMLENLTKGEDGSVTLYIQKDSPGKNLESNWLPAPDHSFYGVLRLYIPEEVVLNGSWKRPLMTAVKQ